MEFKKAFSHIYIEDEAKEYALTKSIVERFDRSQIVPTKHYKNIFNRKKQSNIIQKESKKLIIAKKREPFFYNCSTLIQDFGFDNYIYSPTMMNCLYECSYCLLQGMYGSANIVIFANIEDYFNELKNIKFKTHLSISYDTDLLAFENIYPIASLWIEEIVKFPHITLEIRTKSANLNSLKTLKPIDNLILSWSITPEILEKYEHKAPSSKKREENILDALKMGYRVRICIDPVLKCDNFEKTYKNFIDNFFRKIYPYKIEDIALGVFRMNSKQLKKIKKSEPSDIIINYPYKIDNNIATYEDSKNMITIVKSLLSSYIDSSKIYEIYI